MVNTEFNVDCLRTTPIIADERFDYTSFEVTDINYNQYEKYKCENGHTGARPALLPDSSSYNPNNGRFEIAGIIVYICSLCHKPVYRE